MFREMEHGTLYIDFLTEHPPRQSGTREVSGISAEVCPGINRALADEQYRQWLVDLVRPYTVILMTARPETWMIKTLDRIEEHTGWRPQEACFAPKGWWNPPAIKGHLLNKDVFPIHGEDASYTAIESNPRTREMHAKFAILCFWVTGEGTCLCNGSRLVKRMPL